MLHVVLLGNMDYQQALNVQLSLLKQRQQGTVGDTLLLVEHPPVLTIGRTGSHSHIYASAAQLRDSGVSVYEVSRGGDVTYHGPGQIVGYPIIGLGRYGNDVRQFVGRIGEVFIRLLEQEYGIAAHREEGAFTGVWVGNQKVTAIGIGIKRWISYHGFAFNVNTRLEHFSWINPCGLGFANRGVTSLQTLLGRPLDMSYVNQLVIRYFCEVFDTDWQLADWERWGMADETTAGSEGTKARLAQDQVALQ